MFRVWSLGSRSFGLEVVGFLEFGVEGWGLGGRRASRGWGFAGFRVWASGRKGVLRPGSGLGGF